MSIIVNFNTSNKYSNKIENNFTENRKTVFSQLFLKLPRCVTNEVDVLHHARYNYNVKLSK